LVGLEQRRPGEGAATGHPACWLSKPLTYVCSRIRFCCRGAANARNVALVLVGTRGWDAAARARIIDDVPARTKVTEFADALPKPFGG